MASVLTAARAAATAGSCMEPIGPIAMRQLQLGPSGREADDGSAQCVTPTFKARRLSHRSAGESSAPAEARIRPHARTPLVYCSSSGGGSLSFEVSLHLSHKRYLSLITNAVFTRRRGGAVASDASFPQFRSAERAALPSTFYQRAGRTSPQKGTGSTSSAGRSIPCECSAVSSRAASLARQFLP
jgi:hypothetical protein